MNSNKYKHPLQFYCHLTFFPIRFNFINKTENLEKVQKTIKKNEVKQKNKRTLLGAGHSITVYKLSFIKVITKQHPKTKI